MSYLSNSCTSLLAVVRSRSFLCALTVAFALLLVQPFHVQAAGLKAWQDVKPSKALLEFSMRDRAFKINGLRQMKMNRQGYVIQISKFKLAKTRFPDVIFVVQDLGYSDAVFTQRSGQDMRPRTTLAQWDNKAEDFGRDGDISNRYGDVVYQFYRNKERGNCLYTRQYGGNHSVDVRGGATPLGTTLIHGFYCVGNKLSLDSSDLRDFVEGYAINMN